jgi:hypothetical protein
VVATAIVCLSLGVPCIALGLALGRGARDPEGGGTRRKRETGRGEARPGGFIIGGALLTVLGLALLAIQLRPR